jgi:hypothetical protein
MDIEKNDLDIKMIEKKAEQGYLYHREGRYKEALECFNFVFESRYEPVAEGIDIAFGEWMEDENCPYWLYLNTAKDFKLNLFNYVQNCNFSKKEPNVKKILLDCINSQDGCTQNFAKDILVSTHKIPASSDLDVARAFLLDATTNISSDDLYYYIFGYDY